MRTIKFERISRTFFEVDIEIINEDQFKNEIEDWCSNGRSLNFWDLENEHFASVISIEINELENDDDENNFFEALQDEMKSI